MHQRAGHLFFFAVLLMLNLGIEPTAIAQATVPDNFSVDLVASVAKPTALAWTPDGRMLITAQAGQLRVYHNDILRSTPALDLSAHLCTNRERGLLGVAVDPNFQTNQSIYLYYTFKKSTACEYNSANTPVNRVSRFTLQSNNTVDLASERVLLDNIPSINGTHNAGDLHFGKDGYLYVTVGDSSCDYAGDSGCAGANDAARDRHVLLGKVLRITRDGGIPPDNPFLGAGTARCNISGRTTKGTMCQETFAWGLRNPFRFAFDSNASTTRFFINDVGQDAWEEINEGKKGADYGWNVREGHCANGSLSSCGTPPAGMTNPIYDYQNGSCGSITGGAFVPNDIWPSSFNGAYLFSDYVCGTIFKLTRSGSTYSRSTFLTGLGSSSAVHLSFGPYGNTQALYYTTYANGGQIWRVHYTGITNRAPTASFTASPSSGDAPLLVNFNANASTDPDGDPLTYEWTFGDGATGSGTNTSHTYEPGTYIATLVVRDNRGSVSAPATTRIDSGNTPPTPTIAAPSVSTRFRVGQTITLFGGATDTQDGPLPDSALSWRVTLHHDTHTHPFLGPISGNNVTFTAPPPEDLAAAANSYLSIELTATDSQGRTSTITQNLLPNKVTLTFVSAPAQLHVEVNDTPLSGTQQVVSWEGFKLKLEALAQNDNVGNTWKFKSWSDGGAATHTITTPAKATTYTATFLVASAPHALLEQNGVVVIEAEHRDVMIARKGKSWVPRSTKTGYTAQGYMGAEPDTGTLINSGYASTSPEMQYFVNFKKPGTYYVWVRAHVDSGTSDSIHVGRDGQMLSSADRISSPTFGSWVWVRSTLDGTGARLNISSPGLHTIHVWMREDGFRLDRILLTTSSSYVPRGAGPQESPRQ